MLTKRREAPALLLVLTTGLAAPGQAQTTASDVDEILVTAQRKVQSIQDVPIAVSAFGQQKLESLQVQSPTNLQLIVPNLTYTATNFGGANYTIRGVGASVLGDGADTGVAFHYNGAFLQGGGNSNVFYDVEAVEVLRGPQGTLFGRNATGGAVNLRTHRPVDRLEAFIETTVGNYSTVFGQAMVNIPIDPTLALRLSGAAQLFDGDVRNLTTNRWINGSDYVSGRAALRWRPDTETTIDLTITYSHARGDGLQAEKQLCNRDPIGNLGCLPDRLAPGIPNFAATLNGLAAAATGLVNFGDDPFLGANVPADLRKVAMDFDPRAGEDQWIGTLEVERRLGSLTLNALGAFAHVNGFYTVDNDFAVAPGRFAPVFPDGVPTSAPDVGNLGSLAGNTLGRFDRPWSFERGDGVGRQWLGELRLSSQFHGPFNFLVGGFFLDWRRRENLFQIASPLDAIGLSLGAAPPFFRLETPVADLQSFAIFGEAYVDLPANLRLTTGLRWTRDRKDQSNRSLLLDLPKAFDTNALVNRALTGRAVLEWRPAGDGSSLVYGSYSRGYKGGGFNPQGVVAVPKSFRPEVVDAFELGAKTELGRSATINASAFYYDYRGLQVSNIVNRTSVNDNINAVLWGAELEMTARPSRALSFDLTLSYLKSRIGDVASIDPRDPTGGRPGFVTVKDINTAANCVATDAQLATLLAGAPFGDCAALNLSGGNPVSLRGNSLANSPEWTGRIGLQYDRELSRRLAVRVRADYAVRSDFWGRIFNRDPIDRIRGWGVLNAHVQFSRPDGGWYLRLQGSNLLDADGVTGMYVTDASAGLATNLFLIQRRRYSAVVGARF